MEEEPAGAREPRPPTQRVPRSLGLLRLRKPAIFSRLASRTGSVEATPWSAAKIALISSMATIAATAVLLTALSLLLAQHDDAPVVAEIELPVAPPSAPLPPAAAGIDGGIIAPPYTPASFAGLAPLTAPGDVLALAQAPDAALIEMTPAGALPRIAADGRQPRHVYARPFDQRDSRARLALIVLETGLSRVATDAAIQRLPGAVVLAVDAYAASPEGLAGAARRAGHEIIATIPLQSAVTGQDAGPRALRIHATTEENAHKLTGGLSRFAGYTGVLFLGNAAGLADEAERLEPLLRSLRDRGLLFVDGTGTGPASPLVRMAKKLRLPHVPLDAMVDAASAADIDRQLEGLAAAALAKSLAVGAIYPTPVALERLRGFLARLDPARLVLAPVSAVVTGGQEG